MPKPNNMGLPPFYQNNTSANRGAAVLSSRSSNTFKSGKSGTKQRSPLKLHFDYDRVDVLEQVTNIAS